MSGSVKTELWDRLVNVRDGYSVPLGARGTVIGETFEHILGGLGAHWLQVSCSQAIFL